MGAQWERMAKHSSNGFKLALNQQGQRRSIMRSYAFDAARAVTPAIVAADGDLQFLVDTRDRAVGRSTFSDGAYESDVMREALAIVEREVGRDPVKGRVFVDVGANIGTTSVPAAKLMGAARVLSIEPSPRNFQLLQCNVILNALTDVVTCVQAAVTSDVGAVDLELSDLNFGDHRIRVADVPSGDYREADRPTISVTGAPLDDLLTREGIDAVDVGLLWIDTQGHEGQVLASAPDLLAAGVPAIIEYWPYGLARSCGTDLLHEVIARHYSVAIDVRSGQRMPGDRVSELARSYPGSRDYTDLALIP